MKTTYKFLFGFLFVIVVGVGGWWAYQYNATKGNLANITVDSKLTDSQVQDLIARIGKFLVVPSDEQPSVVVIKNAAELAAQQSFYKGAKDGDILIVYSTRAIIYDAKGNKLVNVGPIVRNDATPAPTASGQPIASASPTPTATATPTPTAIKVDVRNGTSTAGLAGTTASEIKKNKLFTIGVLGDAKGSFKATVVVDLSKGDAGKAAAVAVLAQSLGVTATTTMPAGENASTADALVIVGK